MRRASLREDIDVQFAMCWIYNPSIAVTRIVRGDAWSVLLSPCNTRIDYNI